MQVNKVQNYSIRLGPHHRPILATVAEKTERKPPDVIRRLPRREFGAVTGRAANDGKEPER